MKVAFDDENLYQFLANGTHPFSHPFTNAFEMKKQIKYTLNFFLNIVEYMLTKTKHAVLRFQRELIKVSEDNISFFFIY